MSRMASKQFQTRVEQETNGFTNFRGRRVRVGTERIFVYPNFGDPPNHPDYHAHRFHVVGVMSLDNDCDPQGERMFKVQADDGWKGSAWESELFPLERKARTRHVE